MGDLVGAGLDQKQVAVAQDELTKTRTEMASYLKAHPGVDKTGLDADYARLTSRGEAQTRTVEKLAQSLQDAELQFAAGGASAAPSLSFVVQDVPNLPAAPLAIPASKRLGYPAAGAFLGLLIGLATIYFSYRADHTIRSRDDLVGLGVPVLGYVPRISPREARLLRGYTPLRWVAPLRRDYARKVAASISPLPDEKRIAS